MKTVQPTLRARRRLLVDWREDQWPVSVQNNDCRPLMPGPSACGHASRRIAGRIRLDSGRLPRGFTLIELLVVIAIIGILAGLLLPTLSRVKLRGKITQAKTEMSSLVAAISAYEAEYSRYPASDVNETAAGAGDYTWLTNNVEVMVVLLDVDVDHNAGSKRNPRHLVNITPKQTDSTLGSGLDPGNMLRDPWGTPYAIAVDMNGDNRTMDPTGVELTRPVLVWSFGPDGLSEGPVDDPTREDDIFDWK